MKTIIIIGGSKGIGKATIESLIENNKILNISRTIPEITHPNLTHYSCDVLTDDLPEIDYADALIYCPGSINLKPITRLDIEDFKADFNINVLGAVKAIKTYLKALLKSDNASITLFSTVASKLGMPYHASIATSKSGVEGLVKSLGAELAPKIRVNAIAPTVTNTELASRLLRNDKMKDAIKERHPLKKYLQPEEVAQMVNYLISDNAKSISGQIFKLDYGIISFKI